MVQDADDRGPLIDLNPTLNQSGSARPQGHRDDYRFEVAAYRLSRLLGLNFVPPTVERKIGKEKGSLQAWVEKAMMEKERRAEGITPPDEWYWTAQMLSMQLFDNLVANRDRHQGNLLIDSDWEVWLIDHTQAFRRFPRPHRPEVLQYCKRETWKRLQLFDRKTTNHYLAGFLRREEMDAFEQRRSFIVDQIQVLIDRSGENSVLF
jgi:hypothetical protein